MFVWGSFPVEENEDTGLFSCPGCCCETDFTLIRTWKYVHLFFIPLSKQDLLQERIQCNNCKCGFPITVLAGTTAEIKSAFDPGTGPISQSFGNVVELTESAVAEICKRHGAGRFQADAVVRVTPTDLPQGQVSIAFDFPLADGRDCIGQSRGIPIAVDRADAPELQGCTIDFRDGQFICESQRG